MMSRGRLKRRKEQFGEEDDCSDEDELKRFRHLTEIPVTDNEITKDQAYLLAADKSERYLIHKSSVASRLESNVDGNAAAVANILTCRGPLQSDGKLRHSDDIQISPQCPRSDDQRDTALLNEPRKLSQHALNVGVSDLSTVAFAAEQQCVIDGFCKSSKKDVSCCNEQCLQHTNQCNDEMKNGGQEKKQLEEAAEILWIQRVLNCPICWKKLKTQNARHLHLKKCAARFCISQLNLIELIKKQEHDHQIELLSNSLQETSEELATAKRKSALTEKKKKQVINKNRFKEPQSKLEEDTQLAIALSTSIEDRRQSLTDFVSYSVPAVDKRSEEIAAEMPPLIDEAAASKDALLLLMSRKAVKSSLSTIRGNRNEIAKQPFALLALDQSEVKRRLTEKATALVLEQPDIRAFCDADMSCLPESKLSAKYCLKKSKDFLWCLATQNMETLFNYSVKELVQSGYSSLQQKHLDWKMPDERPELSMLDPATSVLCGSTQTAFVLAELAAEAATEPFFADEFSQKSICSYQEVLQETSLSAAVANGFYLVTDEVCEKSSTDLLNAWSRMVDNDCMSDLTVVCRDGEVIHLHRLVIMARYPNLLQIIGSESSKKVFSQFSKLAALSVVRFIYFADTDVGHAVAFEAKQLAESLQLTDFCRVCENLIKIYDRNEVTSPVASAGAVEECVTCSWSDGLNMMLRDKGESCGGSEKAEEKEEEEEKEAENADLDEVYVFMLSQRKNKMNGGETTEDRFSDDSLMMTKSWSCNESDDEGQDVRLLDVNHSEKPSKVILPLKSFEVMMDRALCDLSLTAKTDELLSEKKECSNVPVESSREKVQQRSDSMLIESVRKNSDRIIDLVAMEDAIERCLSDNDDDDDDCAYNEEDNSEKNIVHQKFGEKFAPLFSAGIKLYDGEFREMSCVSFDGPTAGPVFELSSDSSDVYTVNRIVTSQHEQNEPTVSDTMVLSLKLTSSSSCSSAQGFVPSSGSAYDSPDLFPSSPCSESLASSVVYVQEPCVLLQAAEKLSNVLDSDELFREVSETSESMIADGSNWRSGGSERDMERQSDTECQKYEHIARTVKKISDSFICLEKNVVETCRSQVHADCFSQENSFDAEHHSLLQMVELLKDENCLPGLDGEDDIKVENTAATEGQSLASASFSCCEHYIKSNDMTSNVNRIEDCMCNDEVLSRNVEIVARASKLNESCLSCLVSPSMSLLYCRINVPVVTDEAENGCQMSDAKAFEEIQNADMSDKEYSEKKTCRHCGDVADSSANDDKEDNGNNYDDKNTTRHISIHCDDEVSAAVLDSVGRICENENIWENFPEEKFMSHVSFENEINASHVLLTPKLVKMQGQSTPSEIHYSPPTDMETDVSALMEDVIANSSLLNSDASFDVGPVRAVMVAKPLAIKQVNCFDVADTPVTPLPSYEQMNTSALQQCCHEYGVRRLPKKQMVGVLENIFLKLHPGIPKRDTVKPKQKANKKAKAMTKKGNLATFVTVKRPDGNTAIEQDKWNILTTSCPTAMTSNAFCQGRSFDAKQTASDILKCSDSESDDYFELECPQQESVNDEGENSLEFDADESVLARNEKKTKSKSQLKQDYSLQKEILIGFFSKSTDLYQRILNYEPLELNYLKKLLKEKQIKVTSHFLIDFLDQQNILFTTRNSQSVGNSRRLQAKRKVLGQRPPQR